MQTFGSILLAVGLGGAFIGLWQACDVFRGNIEEQASENASALAWIVSASMYTGPGLVVAAIGAVVRRLGASRENFEASAAVLGAEVETRRSATGSGGPPDATETTDKSCPFCAETIRAAAVVCRFCGRDLPGPQAHPARD